MHEAKLLLRDFRRYVCQTSHDPIGIVVKQAKGCWMTDVKGKRYLDFISGIGVANVGHTHPLVVKALRAQALRHLHVMVYGEYVQAPQVELARELTRVAPRPLSVTYFTNSGTEAVEGALKVAKKATGRRRLIAFEGSFHGDTHGSLSVTGREVYRTPFLPLLPDVQFLPFNNVRALRSIDRTVAAVIVEPIQSEVGVRLPADDFLPAVRHRCTEAGALLIVDEVMTGFGRTGRMFACEHWGVVPDILVMAKALGGGMPLGAFMGTKDVMKTLSEDPPLSHVTTFGGHPVSAAAGLAALRIIMKKKLYEKSMRYGSKLLNILNDFRSLGGITEVRGKGLLIGMEFANDPLAARFVSLCRHAGLLLGYTLHSQRVIRLAPPLTITEEELVRGATMMKQALKKALQ